MTHLEIDSWDIVSGCHVLLTALHRGWRVDSSQKQLRCKLTIALGVDEAGEDMSKNEEKERTMG